MNGINVNLAFLYPCESVFIRGPKPLLFFQRPLDRLSASELRRQLDRVSRDLALVRQLHLVVLDLRVDAEAEGVAFDLPVVDHRLPGELAVRLAGQFAPVLLERERPL